MTIEVATNPQWLAYRSFVDSLMGKTVGDVRDLWDASQDGTLTLKRYPSFAEIVDDSFDDWRVCRSMSLPIFPTCEDFPEGGVDRTLLAFEGGCPTSPRHSGSATPLEIEIVGCPESLLSLFWDYEQGTLFDTTGSREWANVWNDGSHALYDGTTSAFGVNGTGYSHLAQTGGHLPIEEGQTLTLELRGNNRSSSPALSSSQYVVSWYSSLVAVNAFDTDVILTTAGIGNAWGSYDGSLVAPAGTHGFSIRMPRQCGQDDVTVTVTE